nr:methylaspartate mutase [Sulfurovaceae bacterium]
MNRLLIDIGSTYFKIAEQGRIEQYFRNFNKSILNDLESKCTKIISSYSKDDIY